MKHSILVGLMIAVITLAVALLSGAVGANATTLPQPASGSHQAAVAQPTVIG